MRRFFPSCFPKSSLGSPQARQYPDGELARDGAHQQRDPDAPPAIVPTQSQCAAAGLGEVQKNREQSPPREEGFKPSTLGYEGASVCQARNMIVKNNTILTDAEFKFDADA